MGHNHVVLGNPKSIGIPQVDELSTGPPDLGYHKITINFRKRNRSFTERNKRSQTK